MIRCGVPPVVGILLCSSNYEYRLLYDIPGTWLYEKSVLRVYFSPALRPTLIVTKIKNDIFVFFLGFSSLIVTISKIKSEFILQTPKEITYWNQKWSSVLLFWKKIQKSLRDSEIPFRLLRTLVPTSSTTGRWWCSKIKSDLHRRSPVHLPFVTVMHDVAAYLDDADEEKDCVPRLQLNVSLVAMETATRIVWLNAMMTSACQCVWQKKMAKDSTSTTRRRVPNTSLRTFVVIWKAIIVVWQTMPCTPWWDRTVLIRVVRFIWACLPMIPALRSWATAKHCFTALSDTVALLNFRKIVSIHSVIRSKEPEPIGLRHFGLFFGPAILLPE